MTFPFGFQVTVRRPTGYDSHGVKLTEGEPHTIGNCARNQLHSDVVIGGVVTVATAEQLLCDDVDADVREGDELELPDGTRWNVSGRPERFTSPWDGWEPGCTIPIEKTTGLPSPQPPADD